MNVSDLCEYPSLIKKEKQTFNDLINKKEKQLLMTSSKRKKSKLLMTSSKERKQTFNDLIKKKEKHSINYLIKSVWETPLKSQAAAPCAMNEAGTTLYCVNDIRIYKISTATGIMIGNATYHSELGSVYQKCSNC